MKKITITNKIERDFKELVFSIFDTKDNRLYLKKDTKNIKFEIRLKYFDKLIYKKLKRFDNKISFKKLIISDFKYLQKLVDYIDKNKSYTQLSKLQKEIFYTLYERLKKAKFIEFLNVKTCLYCNRNFVINFKNDKKLSTTAQLDHFFSKKDYPYLSVSLYNLIPCCPTCNLRKLDKKVNILHPFFDDIDKEIKFVLKLKDTKFYYSIKGFEIELKTNFKRAKNHIEVFKLEDLYNEHKDIVLELIQKKYMYNESYLDELFRKYEGTFFKNKEDLLRLVSGGYISEEEINKRPLSKLIKDISEELDFI